MTQSHQPNPVQVAIGIKDFVDIVGITLDVGGNNGIIDYNQRQLNRNSCLGPLAKKFYDSIAKDHPSDDFVVGNYKASSNSPGWLWKKALLFAQNDNALAMQLIGLCGHDDIQQGMHFNGPGSQKETECPSFTSDFFEPKSLGPFADISDGLKDRVVKTQSGGMYRLGAKYYHVIGAAYVACVLIEKGDSPDLVKMLSRKAIEEYRAQRLCLDTSAAHDELLLTTPLQEVVNAAIAISHNRNCGSAVCRVLKRNFFGTDGLDDNSIKQKVLSLLNRERAYSYIKEWKSKNWLGCAPGFAKGLQDYLETNGFGKQSPCHADVSANDCAATRHVMATWAIDFDWSEAQHEAGVDFAVRNCSPLPKGRDALQNACSALKSAPDVPDLRNVPAAPAQAKIVH